MAPIKTLASSPAKAIRLPDDVRQDLIRYTQYAGRTLKPQTVAWLREHPGVRPGTSVTVYRGVTIERSDIAKRPFAEIIRHWFGTEVDELAVGAKAMLRRGKPTSWSKDQDVAEGFLHPASYWAQCYGWFLFKAELDPQQIILDFDLVDDTGLHNDGQSEVLSVGGGIPVEIVQFAIREYNPAAMPGRKWGKLERPDMLATPPPSIAP